MINASRNNSCEVYIFDYISVECFLLQFRRVGSYHIVPIIPKHCICFPTGCLTVGKHSHIISLDSLLDKARDIAINISLCRLWPKHSIQLLPHGVIIAPTDFQGLDKYFYTFYVQAMQLDYLVSDSNIGLTLTTVLIAEIC
jgi:hypothetical protein